MEPLEPIIHQTSPIKLPRKSLAVPGSPAVQYHQAECGRTGVLRHHRPTRRVRVPFLPPAFRRVMVGATHASPERESLQGRTIIRPRSSFILIIHRRERNMKKGNNRFTRVAVAWFVALALPPILQARIIYVDDNGKAKGNGETWGQAYADLQAALDVAQSGDEIRVAGRNPPPLRERVRDSLTLLCHIRFDQRRGSARGLCCFGRAIRMCVIPFREHPQRRSSGR